MRGFDIVFLVMTLVSLGLAGYTMYRQQKLYRKIKGVFQSDVIENADEMLESYEKRFQSIEKQLTHIFTQQQEHGIILDNSIHKVSLLKFNPFSDVGGERSFVIALLNADNSGILITYVAMRDGGRTYTKSINKGKSEQTLSQEEKDAIQQAIRK